MPVTIDMPAARIERLEARITPEVKRLIQEAANLEGRTVSEFLITSAQAAARKTIEEYQAMKLSARDREIFIAALLNPPEPSARLKAAAKRYKKTVRS
jgi:uncharacterized protein (DUF1778 family)